MEFKDLKINDKLKSGLMLEGFLTLTEIQKKVLPTALNKSDMLIKSVTGSGKTLTYVIPVLNNIENENVQALVVCPTKELAIQVKNVFTKINKNKDIKISCIYGGSDFTRQRLNLKSANIVIGTPGRLLDHINRRTLKLHKLKTLILDEADVMLNMGFIDEVSKIIKATPKHKQTLMLSATFTDRIKDLASTFLNNPTIIETSSKNIVVSEVNQTYIKCLKKGKFETLIKFLKQNEEKSLIFVNTKKMAEELNLKLKKVNINSIYLHGDLLLKERKRAVNLFQNNVDILIATDVASRGLDISGIEYVINYDLPQDPDTYIHRIGRTARAGKTGMSLSLVNSETQLKFLLDNFSEYKLVELKIIKKDGKNIFISK